MHHFKKIFSLSLLPVFAFLSQSLYAQESAVTDKSVSETVQTFEPIMSSAPHSDIMMMKSLQAFRAAGTSQLRNEHSAAIAMKK